MRIEQKKIDEKSKRIWKGAYITAKFFGHQDEQRCN